MVTEALGGSVCAVVGGVVGSRLGGCPCTEQRLKVLLPFGKRVRIMELSKCALERQARACI